MGRRKTGHEIAAERGYRAACGELGLPAGLLGQAVHVPSLGREMVFRGYWPAGNRHYPFVFTTEPDTLVDPADERNVVQTGVATMRMVAADPRNAHLRETDARERAEAEREYRERCAELGLPPGLVGRRVFMDVDGRELYFRGMQRRGSPEYPFVLTARPDTALDWADRADVQRIGISYLRRTLRHPANAGLLGAPAEALSDEDLVGFLRGLRGDAATERMARLAAERLAALSPELSHQTEPEPAPAMAP